MSHVSSQAAPPRLLPSALENRLFGWFSKLFGAGLLTASIAAALSLMSWSVADPSLTHATSGATRNLTGPLGAIFSDLLMQTLGLASIIALLPPAFWALQLMTRHSVPGAKSKLCLATFSIVAIAASMSALPTPSSWPLRYGFGGVVGDLGLGILGNMLAVINAERAPAAAGLFYLAGGMALLVASLGLTQNDLVTLFTKQTPEGATKPRPWFANVDASGVEDDKTVPHPVLPMAHHCAPPFVAHPEFAGYHPQHAYAPISPYGHQPMHSRQYHDPRDTGFRETGAWHHPAHGAQFDLSTEHESRMMAERFAPESVEHIHASPTPPIQTETTRVAPSGFLANLANGLRRPEPAYKLPPLSMLKKPGATKAGPDLAANVLQGNARLLEDVLGDFGVKGEIKDIKPGPVVTLFELEPARGTKSQRIISLADDIARSMSTTAVRVAVVPGRNAIGIELPNPSRQTVYLRDLLETEHFRSSDAKLPMVLGKSIGGEPIIADLARMPHLLVAGTTGSGKSVGVNAMILSLLYRLSPDECRFLMIDPKMLELSVYNGIPHLLTPVVTDPSKAVAALNWAIMEMEERYKRMAKLAVRNIDVFNNRVRNAKRRGELLNRTVQTGFDTKTGQAVYEHEAIDAEPMPYIVIVVDEFADLMAVAGKEIEFAVQRLAQMARAAGIHLIMATQRPSVDIITGTIKANFPTRISFKVTSKIDSRTILNEQGAEQLLGQGDMLFAGGMGQIVRVHGPFVADEEVETIAEYLRGQGEPKYVTGITDAPANEAAPQGGARVSEDDLYDRAVAIVVRDQKASTSYIQRRMQIGYNRAADLIERMERDGIISPAGHTGRRMILVAPSGTDTGE
jgi:DNA segregation ATPase FtsK/SpoIIIE, S-DNA-T family